MISPGLYSEISQEAHARYRRWQMDMRGRATAGMPSEKEHLEWWIAEVALERGMGWTRADADREADFVMDMTDKQIEDDARWRGECPKCLARAFDDVLDSALSEYVRAMGGECTE